MKQAIIAAALLLICAVVPAQEPAVCDVNGDAQVDRPDVTLVRAAIGQHVAVGDPRDPTGDGRVTINDVRACVLMCTHAGCASTGVLAVAPAVCDVNEDGAINRTDLLEIRAKNQQTSPPADPKYDPNGDGRINVADMRYCQLRCTTPNCVVE